MDMNELLEKLYERESVLPALEKTAETRLMEELSSEPAEENPFLNLSTSELIKLAQDLDEAPEESIPEEFEDSDEDLQKVAMDMLGGQIMAHSMVHEFGLMKVALAQGFCRVCKTNAMNLEGSSICSECLGE